MKLEYKCMDEGFHRIIDTEQELKVEADGFTFIEGPIWNKETQCLTFNDIPVSKTYRFKEGKGVWQLRGNTHKANGNAYDREGNIVVCEHVRSCISRTDDNGEHLEILVKYYQDKELNSPNDVVVRSDGRIFFTDPVFGRNPSHVGLAREQELDFQGVYSYEPKTGELRLLADDFENPNGLCFSLDENYLYVNDSPRLHIRRFRIKDDDTLTGGEVFAATVGEGVGKPDGMKIDRDENIYCCAQGGVHIFDKVGSYLGIVYVPEQVGNCAFGGKNMDTLYLAATHTLYSFKIKTCAP